MTTSRKYRLAEPRAYGLYGVIYRATRCPDEGGDSEEPVVMESLDLGAADAARLRRQLQARLQRCAGLRHPNVARQDGVIDFNGRPMLVGELLDGCSLAAILERHGPVPIGVAAEVALQVAAALHAAYDAIPRDRRSSLNLVHGDLRPEHIAITASGAVKVGGFGVEPREERGALVQAAPGDADLLCSTPYASPEALQGVASHASDIYALGAILSHMVTGVGPAYAVVRMERPDCGIATVMGGIAPVRGGFAPVKGLASAGVSSSLVRAEENEGITGVIELIDWAMSLEPGARPSAEELRTWLKKVRDLHPQHSLTAWAEDVVRPLQAELQHAVSVTPGAGRLQWESGGEIVGSCSESEEPAEIDDGEWVSVDDEPARPPRVHVWVAPQGDDSWVTMLPPDRSADASPRTIPRVRPVRLPSSEEVSRTWWGSGRDPDEEESMDPLHSLVEEDGDQIGGEEAETKDIVLADELSEPAAEEEIFEDEDTVRMQAVIAPPRTVTPIAVRPAAQAHDDSLADLEPDELAWELDSPDDDVEMDGPDAWENTARIVLTPAGQGATPIRLAVPQAALAVGSSGGSLTTGALSTGPLPAGSEPSIAADATAVVAPSHPRQEGGLSPVPVLPPADLAAPAPRSARVAPPARASGRRWVAPVGVAAAAAALILVFAPWRQPRVSEEPGERTSGAPAVGALAVDPPAAPAAFSPPAPTGIDPDPAAAEPEDHAPVAMVEIAPPSPAEKAPSAPEVVPKRAAEPEPRKRAESAPPPVQRASMLGMSEPRSEAITQPAPPRRKDPESAPVAAAPPHGTVLISGDAHRAWLLRGGRRYRAESIPPGSYQVQVIFTEGAAVVNAGSVEIASGATTSISCSAKFLRCSIQ